jgi:hypothetical protein
MPSIESIQEAIRSEGLAGWLFYNYKHRDPLSDRILEIPADTVNTRPWYLLVPGEGKPVKIVHSIETSVLAHLPGRETPYGTRNELRDRLAEAAEAVGGPVCAGYSELLPALSFLDHGTARLLEECGFRLTGSAGCLQRVLGALPAEGRDSHRRAGAHLYEIVSMAWKQITKDLSEGNPVTEGSIRDYMLAELDKRNLTTDHPPIVAVGPNSGDPHYTAAGDGDPIVRDRVVLFDIWAKEKSPDAVYADISWMGYTSPTPPIRIVDRFQTLTHARDMAFSYIAERCAGARSEGPAGPGPAGSVSRGRQKSGEPDFPTGAEVDRKVREYFRERGLESFLRHRTGHAIDTECHGFGANIDSVEFPEERRLIEGSCFSLEPGLYGEEYGMRTEIDVLIENSRPTITGGRPQTELLTL